MAVEIFNLWLTKKLESFDIEDEVMGTYISSIITADESESEKEESLRDLLLDLLHDVDVDAVCREILGKWSECHSQSDKVTKEDPEKARLELSQKVAFLVGQQVHSIAKPIRSEEEQKLREAILTRCTFVSSDEEGDDSEEGTATTSQSAPINHNAEAVAQAEKEKRNKLKMESDQKKAQDKVNREKQKVKQDERREKERKRTQKQERRR